jgi:hypothetical protein
MSDECEALNPGESGAHFGISINTERAFITFIILIIRLKTYRSKYLDPPEIPEWELVIRLGTRMLRDMRTFAEDRSWGSST